MVAPNTQMFSDDPITNQLHNTLEGNDNTAINQQLLNTIERKNDEAERRNSP